MVKKICQALAWAMASTTYSTCGGTMTVPYLRLARGEVKAVALVAIVRLVSGLRWALVVCKTER